MHPSDPPLLAGRYRLGECLGEGGMARVYRAEDVALGRTVAIKRMRGTVDDHEPRVRSEMTLLAGLSHPSLVTLFDAHLGDDPRSAGGEGDFLVMEYVEGPTLSRCLADGPLPPHTAAALAMDLADALHAVHAAGIVHRDIKPSNILLSPSPLPMRQFRAKLADFGIAYLRDSARITSPGIVLGTAAYLAPEQVRGEAPTPAADIFSLGLVLLEALTGLRAYRHTAGAEALVVRLSTAPDIPPDLSDGWRELLLAMTSLEAADRPTALEVAVAASALTTTATLVTMPPAAPAAPVAPTPVPAAPGASLPDTVALAATLPATLPATVPAPVALGTAAAAPVIPLVASAPPPGNPGEDVAETADDSARRSRRVTLLWGAAAVVSLFVAGGAGALTGAFGTAGAVPTVISEPAPVRLIPELPPTEQVAEVTTDDAAPVEPVVPAQQPIAEPDPPAADTPPASDGNGAGDADGAGGGNGPGTGGPPGPGGDNGAGPGNGNGAGNGAGAGGGNGPGNGSGNGAGGPGGSSGGPGNGNGGSGSGNGGPGPGNDSTATPVPTPTPAPSGGSEEEATLG